MRLQGLSFSVVLRRKLDLGVANHAPTAKTPSYCHHRASGQAVVRVSGRDVYLGKYGSAESHERYEQFVAQWRAEQKSLGKQAEGTPPPIAGPKLTINEVLLAYVEYAKEYYSRDGKPTGEFESMKLALRPLRRLYGSTPANSFGPKSLKLVREQMISDGLSRKLINSRVNRIRRFFKWAVAEELVSPTLLHGLQAVSPLRYGRTTARETEPVRPVSKEQVEAVLPYTSPQVGAMIRLQQLTGMRPGEVVLMRSCDIDRSAEVWLYEPHTHKNRWRGHRRQIALGPQAKAVLQPFLARDPEAYLFSPRESEQSRNEQRRHRRKTPMTPSQRARKPTAKPNRGKRDRYDVHSYRRAINYGIKRAGVAHWSPLQLRHTKATEVRREFGLEAAQVVLGHVRADVTEVYAERNLMRASEIATLSG